MTEDPSPGGRGLERTAVIAVVLARKGEGFALTGQRQPLTLSA